METPAANERFVNNEILDCLVRPQYPHACSIAAMTGVLNYLYASQTGPISQEEVARHVGLSIGAMEEDQGPGNAILLEWFDSWVNVHGLAGECAIFADGTGAEPQAWDGPLFEELKAIVRSPDAILLHHLPGHYNLVCGFVEHASKPQFIDVPNAQRRRWIVMADSSSQRDPLWSRSWSAMRDEFLADSRPCLLLFTRERGE